MNFSKISLKNIQVEEELILPLKGKKYRSSLFLKGPISWKWLCTAASLPGKALHVAIGLKFLEGLKKSNTVPLSGKVLNDLGVNRRAKYRVLTALEDAGLIFVERHSGRNPVVTILEVEEADDESK